MADRNPADYMKLSDEVRYSAFDDIIKLIETYPDYRNHLVGAYLDLAQEEEVLAWKDLLEFEEENTGPLDEVLKERELRDKYSVESTEDIDISSNEE